MIFILFQLKFDEKNWGLGIGDWGLGIGDWAQSPIPKPPSPIPIPNIIIIQKFNSYKLNYIYILIT